MQVKAGFGVGIGLGVAATLLIALAIWLLVVYTGGYNVAATNPHTDFMRWTLDTTMHQSIKDRADAVQEPDSVSQESVAAGAKTYANTCAHCHGAPGTERETWAANMRPEPPELIHAAAEWEAREVFWIVKHGIKMSGMPPFGPEHDDEAIWGITTFVKQLPGMTAKEYRSVTAGAGHASPAGH